MVEWDTSGDAVDLNGACDFDVATRTSADQIERARASEGDGVVDQHFFVLIPSAVSDESWNLLFNPDRAAGRYELTAQKRFVLDARLRPPI